MDDEYTITKESTYGYRRINPVPTSESLSKFYQSQYPELLEEGELGASLSRLRSGGEEAHREQEWKEQTEYRDVAGYAESQGGTGRLLDIGCGTGAFLSFMRDRGWEAHGIEPSAEIAAQAEEDGLNVFEGTVQSFVAEQEPPEFDLITLWTVLEHVPNPQEVINCCTGLLRDGGHLAVKIPNDFNPLQMAASERLNANRFWVSAPTHINYFDVESVRRLLADGPLDECWVQTDFPMSLFLLFGRNYLDDSDVGKRCH